MVEETRQPDSASEHASVRYERTDASFAWIVGTSIAAVILLTGAFISVVVFYRFYSDHQARIKESAFPLAPTPGLEIPPEPRLEQVDRLAGVRSSNVKEDFLASYGPTGDEGFIHVPIDRAMKLLANKLPARREPARTQNRSDGLLDAGESNSGRLFRGKSGWYER